MFEEVFEELKVKLLEGLKEAWKAFIDTLWEFLKEDVILSARKSLKIIENYLNSTDGQDKKQYIIDLIMEKIKLPLVLKPFKFIVRKMVQDKIDAIIKELGEKADLYLTTRQTVYTNNNLKIFG
jgi:hypothetical protein